MISSWTIRDFGELSSGRQASALLSILLVGVHSETAGERTENAFSRFLAVQDEKFVVVLAVSVGTILAGSLFCDVAFAQTLGLNMNDVVTLHREVEASHAVHDARGIPQDDSGNSSTLVTVAPGRYRVRIDDHFGVGDAVLAIGLLQQVGTLYVDGEVAFRSAI